MTADTTLKLKPSVFKKEMQNAIGFSSETMHTITIREANTTKKIAGKTMKKCFIVVEKLGKGPKGLMASMLWEGDFSDIEEVWLEEAVSENGREIYVFSPEHVAKIVSAMKHYHCGCSATISMAAGINYSTDFIDLLK